MANLAVPVVGLVLASRRPANRIGWLFLAAGLALGLSSFSSAYALRALLAEPGSWPAGRAAGWLSNWVWVIPYAMVALVFVLFPTGQPRSRRWRAAEWLVAGAFTLAVADQVAEAVRDWNDPFVTTTQPNPPDVTAAYALMAAALVVSVAALVVRFARSSAATVSWLGWSGCSMRRGPGADAWCRARASSTSAASSGFFRRSMPPRPLPGGWPAAPA